MKILFVGLHYRFEEEQYLIDICKGAVSAAHFKLENNIIAGIKSSNAEVEVLSSLPVGNFPLHNKKLFFKSKIFEDDFTEIGFINLPIFKHYLRRKKLSKILNSRLKNNKNEKMVILVYDMYLPFIEAAINVCKKYDNCKIVTYLPDLPGNLSLENKIYGFIKNSYLNHKAKKFYKIINKFDGYIVLTKFMLEAIHAQNKPNLIIEGITEIKQKEKFFESETNKKVILYAGQLNINNGIDVLMKAFEEVPNANCELWICGRGAMENIILKYSSLDNRIKYLGYKSTAEMISLQNEADIFINPRQNVYEYTKFSFPSKNLEYLREGKPVIAYKLSGVPDEYDDYIFYPESNTVKSLADCILKVLNLSEHELQELAYRQTEFINNGKSIEVQGSKIVGFLRGLF